MFRSLHPTRLRPATRHVLAVLAVAGALSGTAEAGSADVTPAQVDARYKVTLNGFDLGHFQFNSNVTDANYTLDTTVELSALLGVIKWKGTTRSTGTIVSHQARPDAFQFDYESTVKNGSVSMGFDTTGVERVAVQPVASDPPDMVPLKAVHLKGVVDPLTAIMNLTHAAGGTPCGRKVAIFDGKQRFDLDLTYARDTILPGAQPGTTEVATVCRVKYQPLGGYRANEETRSFAQSKGIEIAFRNVPAARLMVPQTVTIPTLAGVAELALEQVNITPGARKLAQAAD